MNNIEEIKKDINYLEEYLKTINKFIIDGNRTINDVIDFVSNNFDGIPNKEDRDNFIKKSKNKDKGLAGKILEYVIFNQEPNSKQEPDLKELDIDIKTTCLKRLKDGNYNAKERLTITNCGNSNCFDSFKNIKENEELSDTIYYNKIRKGILIIMEHNGIKYNKIEVILNMRVLSVIYYDIENMNQEIFDTIKNDYACIKKLVDNKKKITQKGQKYLHIHTHGSKNSKTRAFGFKNKFVTTLLAFYISKQKNINIDNVLGEKGSSIFIKQELFQK